MTRPMTHRMTHPMKHLWRYKSCQAAALVLALWAQLNAALAHAGCAVSSNGLAFGAYRPLSVGGMLVSSPVDSVTTVSVNCDLASGLLGYTLKLGPSAAGNTIAPRFLANAGGGNPMAFNVYTDAGHSAIWGDGSTGNVITHGVLNGTFQHTLYGRIPAGQNTLKAGSYSGLLTITVTYNP